nr:amidase domain-containing protein [Streptomyces luteoverticillatus]
MTLRAAAGVVASLALPVALMPANPAGAAARPGGVDRATAESFGRIAGVVLTDRTAAIVDGKVQGNATPPSAEKAHLSSAMARSEKSVVASLRQRKKELKVLGEAYSAGDTRVAVDRTGIDGKKAVIRVTETTRLTYRKIRGDEPEDTGFQAHHELSFAVAGDGAWELTGIRALDEMPQINAPAPTAPKVKAAAAGDMPNAPEASVWPFPKRLPKDTATGLDYKAMAEYAEKYWKNYNPDYRAYPLGTGGDCTNFVSQALKAGGWKHAPGKAGDYTKWWYGSDTQSDSWTGVNEWSWFAQNSKRVKPLKYVYQMEVGDVLQADFDRDGSKDHTMLVTYRDSLGTPYLTYHSFDTYRRSMLSLSVMLPLTKWYAYRT